MARPTARGWQLLVVAAGVYIAARLFGTWELYLLAVAFAAAVGVSWLLVSISARRLAVSRTVAPPQPAAGDPLTLTFRVERAPALPGLQVSLPGALGDLGSPGEVVEFDTLGPRATRGVDTAPVPARRGVHLLPPLLADMEDPLGLVRARRRFGDTLEVVVFPRVVQLPSCVLFGGAGRRLEPSLRGRPAGGASEFRGIRPHYPGEALDHVDWKATAKTGSLMLREMDDPSSGEVTLLLSGPAGQVAGAAPDTNFELAIEAAGAIAGYALRAGRKVMFLRCERDWRRTRLTPGAEGRQQLLMALARLEPHAPLRLGPSLRPLLAGHRRRTHLDLVVLVVLSLDRELVRAVSALRREGLSLAVVYLDAASFGAGDGGRAETQALLLSLEAVGVQTLCLPRGADLGAALSVWSPLDSRAGTPV